MLNFWSRLLKWAGWSVEITTPWLDKCVICVAPHTSNWDFILGLAAYKSMGRKANFLMKEFWFFFPLKYILKRLGGIPVPSKKGKESLTDIIINRFNQYSYLNLAVTPEGTRSRRDKWKTGFLYISYGAEVPIQLGIIDYKSKKVIIKDTYYPTGRITEDMAKIKQYYSGCQNMARYPEKFTT